MPMTDTTSLQNLEAHLAEHHIPVDVLRTFFQLATLDRSRPDWRTTLDDQICACIQLLGGVREPDLIKITGVDQSTINRRVRALHAAGTIRTITYTTGTAGKPAKWLQPPESADLDAPERAERLTVAQHIIAYRAAWLASQPVAAAPAPDPAPTMAPEPPLPADEPTPAPEQPQAATTEAITHPDPAPAESASAADQPPAPALAPPKADASTPIREIPTHYPVPLVPVPAAPRTPAQAVPPLWYRSFYLWMAPLIALGSFSYLMNEWAAIVAFTTQVGIPLLWLSGAIFLISLLVEHRETVFARFYPVEHRALVVASLLILAVAIVQSGLWDLARTRWTGTALPSATQPAPIAAAPTPLTLPELAIPRPTATCPHSGPARISAPRGLRLRQSPNTAAAVLTTIPQHTSITMLCTEPVTSEGIRWAHIQHGTQQGWVAADAAGTSYLTRP